MRFLGFTNMTIEEQVEKNLYYNIDPGETITEDLPYREEQWYIEESQKQNDDIKKKSNILLYIAAGLAISKATGVL